MISSYPTKNAPCTKTVEGSGVKRSEFVSIFAQLAQMTVEATCNGYGRSKTTIEKNGMEVWATSGPRGVIFNALLPLPADAPKITGGCANVNYLFTVESMNSAANALMNWKG